MQVMLSRAVKLKINEITIPADPTQLHRQLHIRAHAALMRAPTPEVAASES